MRKGRRMEDPYDLNSAPAAAAAPITVAWTIARLSWPSPTKEEKEEQEEEKEE